MNRFLLTLLFMQVLKSNAFFGYARRFFTPTLETKTPNGFYGLIGPNIKSYDKTSLFDLFTGDGVIQGVFLQNDTITYKEHIIKTDKWKYEQKKGAISENPIIRAVFIVLQNHNILPNIFGVANTALLKTNKRTLALYERDMPYEIDIDFDNKSVNTIGKIRIPGLRSFSAHSKLSNSVIETLDYHVTKKCVNYMLLNENLEPQNCVSIHTEYLPIIHDFLSTKDSIIVADSPIVLKIHAIFENKLPVVFDKSKKTIFHVLKKGSSFVEKYVCDEGFYLFHFAQGEETDDSIEFFASIYENLDFSNLRIHGKYRRFILNKITKKVSSFTNPVLETMNLDFPVMYGDKIVLRNVENNCIKELVICQDLNIISKITLENKMICGEPAIIPDTPNLVFFANDLNTNQGLFVTVNLETLELTYRIVKNDNLLVGFHSIFISK